MSDLSAIQQAQRIYDAMLPEDDDEEDPIAAVLDDMAENHAHARALYKAEKWDALIWHAKEMQNDAKYLHDLAHGRAD